FEFSRPGQVALDQGFRQRILDILLQRAAQRTGAVAAVCTGFFKDVLGSVVGQPNFDLLRRQVLVDLDYQQVDDLDKIFVRQGGEQDHVVQAVQKFGIEGALYFASHHVLDLPRNAFGSRRGEA